MSLDSNLIHEAVRGKNRRALLLKSCYISSIYRQSTFSTDFFDDIADLLSFGLILTLRSLLVILILIFLNPKDSSAKTLNNVGLTQRMAL